jgi:DNA invertase Pin-like site-specific DNA recombinase
MDRLWQLERRLVYGYLCVEEPDENQVATWTKEIAAFANKSGYRLGSIFIDSGLSTSSVARGGFIELLTALRLPEAYAAVVPSLAHLSTDTFLQQVLVHMLQATDSQLLVSSVINGSSPEVELSTESGSES